MKSLRGSFIRYLIPSCVVCAVGAVAIEALTTYLQHWYLNRIWGSYDSLVTEAPDNMLPYDLLYYARVVLVPIWAVLCLLFTARVFYRREIKAPVDVLTRASERILGDDLDFSVECDSRNELGALCGSFEEMRKNLYDSNYRLWKSLEERKRLNSAFSHDLRTPITVLKGYMELMEQYDGELSPEKQSEILAKMSGQVGRLEHYTEKMSSLHKLEDIIPDVSGVGFGTLCAQLGESGRLLCGDERFSFAAEGDARAVLYTDTELIMQVFMNLVSNAQRYAASRVECAARLTDGELLLTVSDDGCGFSEEALRKAWQPFYRADNENDREHFGLGLYICHLLCRKAGGSIAVGNGESGGGTVTARFSKNISENR